ncbi:hypothetical protein KC887_07870 [Candidatus Kaiserbacteria bacterium]|nr:hypothetical protein [Candidatus Kaiserbacteria bacterium]
MGLDNRKIVMSPGDRYGRWEIVKESSKRSSGGIVYWYCRCECGVTRDVSGTSLRNGRSKSCGCLGDEMRRLEYGEASFNKLFKLYKIGAAERGLRFSLTKKQFKELTSSNCFYCGDEPSRACKNNGKKGRFYGNYIYNGIDRVDNSLGYLPKNCIPCCFECNQAKLTSSQDEFLKRVKKIYEHLGL